MVSDTKMVKRAEKCIASSEVCNNLKLCGQTDKFFDIMYSGDLKSGHCFAHSRIKQDLQFVEKNILGCTFIMGSFE